MGVESAAGRLAARLGRADLTEGVAKESQTVLITLLSCRFMSATTDSAWSSRFVTGAWRGGTFNPQRGHRLRASMRKRARPPISRRNREKFAR
jgi:hypothetical protein